MNRLLLEGYPRGDGGVSTSHHLSPLNFGPGGDVLSNLADARRILFQDYEPLGRQNNVQSQASIADESVKAPRSGILPFSAAAAGALWKNFAGTSGRVNYRDEQAHLLRSSSVSAGCDRFIPRRKGMNFDYANYQMVSYVDKAHEHDSHYLDVFEEVERATKHWRRSYMEAAFEATDMFRDTGNKRVLNIIDKTGQQWKRNGSRGDQKYEFGDDSQWCCRPRKRPLLNMKGENSKRYRDHGAQIFRFSKPIRFKNLIDWSSNNILIAGLIDTMCLCCVDFKSLSKVYRLDYNAYISCLKWNKPGTFASICGMDSSTSLYDAELKTIKWKVYCHCRKVDRKACKVIDIVWANKHNHLITACDEGILNVFDPADGKILTLKNFKTEILAISLSPGEQYFVESGNDQLVKVFQYPTLVQLFEIAFFTYVKALAWHPWKTGLLCIGGGPGDGSLSLWNVNTQSQLGYRKIRFVGCVDTLLFNDLSGELVVHWFYLDDDRLHSKIVVMSSLDKVVDAVPIQSEHKILNVLWSPNHTKLAMQYRETFLIWDFFGNEINNWLKPEETKKKEKSSEFFAQYFSTNKNFGVPLMRTISAPKRGKSFSHYRIR